MEVRLLTRWGSRLQGDTVSVSVERAKALAEAGIGRILDAPAEQTNEEALEAEQPVEPTAEQARGKNGGKGKA